MNRFISMLKITVLVVLSAVMVFSVNGCKKSESENMKDLIPYSYDDNGNPTAYIKNEDLSDTTTKTSVYSAKGELLGATEYTNDEKGNRIKEVSYDKENKITDTIEHEYNENNKLTKSSYYDSSEKLTYYIIREYTESGKEKFMTKYNPDDSVSEKDEYFYDENDYCNKRVKYDGEGNIRYYYVYEMQNDGTEVTYQYNKNGELISKD